MFLLIALTIVLAILPGQPIYAENNSQNIKSYSNAHVSKIKKTLSFISNDLTKGRQTGTNGSLIVSSFLRNKLKSMEMIPFYNKTLTQSFIAVGDHGNPIIGRNIIGVLPSLYYSDKYVIISAHYDHLGILGGQIYNGADDNASGVTALLTIAEWFYNMRKDRVGPKVNIIFAFFDAKENNMAGSEFFAKNLKIPASKIKININLDQLGCTFAPPGAREDYLLYVADKELKSELRRKLNIINKFYGIDMEIDHTFYSSSAFYEIFMKTSDQHNLSKVGIPSMLFTSGIHMHTYKPTDEYYFINYPVFIKRIQLIFHLIEDYVK